MKLRSRAHPLASTFIAIAASITQACGGTATAVLPTNATLTVSPESAVVVQGGTQLFKAQWADGAPQSVIWTVDEGAAGGTVAATGMYTAPDTPGTFRVRATSSGDGRQVAVATVTVLAPGPKPAIGSFSAQPASISQGQNSTLSWSVADATSLSIGPGVGDVTGKTTAVVSPPATTAYTLTATNPSGSATKTVTVTVVVPGVSVTPVLVYLWPGTSETFKAQVTGLGDTSVSWSVLEGSAGGTVSSSGAYTAPSGPGTYHVVATSVADPSKSASASVVVTAPPAGCPTPPVQPGGATPAAVTQTPGTWMNVTPAGIDPSTMFVGVESVLADPVRKGDIYVNIEQTGTFKSSDYGTTWKKMNTGTNGAQLDTGAAWYAAIDLNPCRDPSTAPALYVVQGYGAGGIWKSVDSGVNWTNVWNNNIYAPDGVTNIFSDVGSDIHVVQIADPMDPNHLVATLHSYWGTGNNNGIFETTDGGGKWIVHKSQTFDFQPHNDIFYAIDAKTWIVTPGDITKQMQRTTDGGVTWNPIGLPPERSIGRNPAVSGSTIYSGTDYSGSVYKSTDRGASWQSLKSGGKTSWVTVTATNLYVGSGYGYAAGAAQVLQAPLSNDTSWVTETPAGMMQDGSYAVTTFDGSHYIIIAAQQRSGVWRYVEP
jgi:acyl-coenzyme A thioesterase PaaI-like protein